MSSIPPRTIAVFGYGNIGKPIALALAERGATLLIFSRDSWKLTDAPANAKVFTVDYADEEVVSKILDDHAVDVVVSTLAIATLESLDVVVARASKKAGVKLFLPSEYGFSSAGYTGDNISAVKEANAVKIKALGLPTARLMTGIFMEFIPWLVADRADPTSGKFIIAGKGEQEFSTTSVSDIAGFIAHILTTRPLSDLSDTILPVEGQVFTLREVASMYGKEPTYVPLESFKPISGSDIVPFLFSLIDSGHGRSGFSLVTSDNPDVVDQKSDRGNGLWPVHTWQHLKDAVPSI